MEQVLRTDRAAWVKMAELVPKRKRMGHCPSTKPWMTCEVIHLSCSICCRFHQTDHRRARQRNRRVPMIPVPKASTFARRTSMAVQPPKAPTRGAERANPKSAPSERCCSSSSAFTNRQRVAKECVTISTFPEDVISQLLAKNASKERTSV